MHYFRIVYRICNIASTCSCADILLWTGRLCPRGQICKYVYIKKKKKTSALTIYPSICTFRTCLRLDWACLSSISALCHFKCYTGIDSIGLLSGCNDVFFRELIKLFWYWCTGSLWVWVFVLGKLFDWSSRDTLWTQRDLLSKRKDIMTICDAVVWVSLNPGVLESQICPLASPPVMMQANATSVQHVSHQFLNTRLLLLQHLPLGVTPGKVDNLNRIPIKWHRSVQSSIS